MTTQERLVIYEQALIDWSKNREEFSDLKDKEDIINYGFCNYFVCIGHSNSFGSIPAQFIELLLQKPKRSYNTNFWFKQGDKTGRIKCLKRAIKLCKINLENESNSTN